MRRDKLSGGFAGPNIAEAANTSSILVIDIDAVAQVVTFLIHGHAWAELADVTDRILRSGIHVKRARPMHIVPLRFVLSIAIKNLDSMIFAIGDVNPTVLIRADIVDDVELTWISAWLAP